MKTKNIVPISFIAGTGGRFVSYLINSAKAIKPANLELSRYGNAHNIWDLHIELGSAPYSNFTPAGEHAKFFFQVYDRVRRSSNYITNNPLPYYGSCHADDIDTLLWYFDKVINISFDYDDIHNIALTFVGKALVDDANIIDTDTLMQMYSDTITRHVESIRKQRYDLEPNLLNISWKDIYQNEPSVLISKLSDFCNIPYDKFNIDMLIEWRRRTNICINEMSLLLDNIDKVTLFVPIISEEDKLGKFVEYFINTAKFNRKTKIILSDHGEILNVRTVLDKNPEVDDSFVQIKLMIDAIPKIIEKPPMYYARNIKDYDLVKSYFEKSIIITNDRNDSSTDRLFISKTELCEDNIDELIEKISIFTNIKSTYFNRDNLIEWRNKIS